MKLEWDGANETDVREEFLAPLLKALGYKRGTTNDISTEYHLYYDKASLGRRKAGDPKLTGKADYLLRVGGVARWVLEAKAPAELSSADIDQTLSYARHPEISAIYAAVSNGKEFRLYASNQMSDDEPLIRFDVTTLEDALERLAGTLHPTCVLRDFKPPMVSQNRPISAGRRSHEEIAGGFIRHLHVGWRTFVSLGDDEYDHINETFRRFHGMQFNIIGGAIERDPQGRIVGRYNWGSPHPALEDINERKGLTNRPIYCLDEEISQDPANPSVFDAAHVLEFAEGEPTFDLASWNETVSRSKAVVNATGQSVGYLNNNVFCGFFNGEYLIQPSADGTPILHYWSSGSFEVYLRD